MVSIPTKTWSTTNCHPPQRPLGKSDYFPNEPRCVGSQCLHVTSPGHCMMGKMPQEEIKALSQEPECNMLCKGDTCCSSSFELLARCRFQPQPHRYFIVDFAFSVAFKQRCSVQSALCWYKLIEHLCAWHFTWHYHPIPHSQRQCRKGNRCRQGVGSAVPIG